MASSTSVLLLTFCLYFLLVLLVPVDAATARTNQSMALMLHKFLQHTYHSPLVKSLEEVVANHGTPVNGIGVCEAPGISCDVDGIPSEIRIVGVQMGGSLDFRSFPPTLRVLVLEDCGLVQDISEIKDLPEGIEILKLGHNYFRGELSFTGMGAAHSLHTLDLTGAALSSVDWPSLKPALKELILVGTKITSMPLVGKLPRNIETLDLSGSTALSGVFAVPSRKLRVLRMARCPKVRLPSGLLDLETQDSHALRVLDLSENGMVGSVRWSTLPDNLEELHLNGNQLMGTFSVGDLPSSLRTINVRKNNFKISFSKMNAHQSIKRLYIGANKEVSSAPTELTLPWDSLPSGLEELDASQLSLSGIVPLLNTLPSTLTYFNIAHNHLIGIVDFTKVPQNMKFLYLNDNWLTGPVDLSLLPRDIRVLHVMNNHWDDLMPAAMHPYDDDYVKEDGTQ
eukprot:PhM_4_TR6320/c0_g1_i2/m.78841